MTATTNAYLESFSSDHSQHVDEKTPLITTSPRRHNINVTQRHALLHNTFLRTLILVTFVMVAIPTYLFASSALSALKPNFSIQGRSSNVEPQNEVRDVQGPFSSLLGPLIETNFPDPTVIWHPEDDTTYAFATHNKKPAPDHINVQIATSKDNKTWELQPTDALPKLAAWETGAGVWAPDIKRLPNGKFVMYYSDNVASAPNHHCVGAALSDTITGPYAPLDQPLACPDPATKGGAIDPAGFVDPPTGKRYLLYKVDGNSLGHGGACGNDIAPIIPTPLMLQEVDKDDGITLIGEPVELLDRDALDGPLIEAPAMHRSEEGIYFLFFSSNCFTTPLYDTSYATSTSITGPFVKSGRPLVVTGDGPDLIGPGGMDIISGGDLIVFHGHLEPSNSPQMMKQAEEMSKQQNKPVKDLHLPLVRGMYSGTATFSGTSVSLRKT